MMVSLEIEGRKFYASTLLDATTQAIETARTMFRQGQATEARKLYESAVARRQQMQAQRIR